MALSTPPSSPGSSHFSEGNAFPVPLNFQQALSLARKMRNDLKTHTKDRKWRLKSYPSCFKATHALSWALENISSDETVAVNRLNQLIDYGMISHVVDPTKKFRVGETRTLYFRMVHGVLDADYARQDNDIIESSQAEGGCPGKGIPLITGNFGSGLINNTIGVNSNTETMQQQIMNIDHILQETVKELNTTRGKLEIVHQEVLNLISQQIATFFMIFVLYIYIIIVSFPTSGMSWMSSIGLGISMLLSTRYGWRCISLWSDLDSQTVPIESVTIAGDDERSLATQSSIIGNLKSYDRKPTATSITSLLSKSLQSVTGGRSLRKLPSTTREIFMREAYSLPNVKSWPHRPLLICANTTASPSLKVLNHDGLDACPLGVPFQFSSELFEGTCLIRLKGTNSDDPDGDAEYFAGRKRIFQSVVQGRFKEEVPVSEVLTGHEFGKPLKNLPHPFILKTATNFIGKVSPGANVVVHTDQPFVEVPLGSSSQIVRGDEPGNEPNITSRNIAEDCSVFGGAFSRGNVSASRRKRLFASPAKCKNYKFDTETVYTFEFYQNLFDAQTYSLDLGFAKIGCSKVLNDQPIQWLGKMRDGRYLWSFQIWHEKLLDNDGSGP